jgi:hypothetical protein
VSSRRLTELHEGLRHGFFEYGLTCEVIGSNRRRLQLHAGKNYQFIIPADECQSGTASATFKYEGAA